MIWDQAHTEESYFLLWMMIYDIYLFILKGLCDEIRTVDDVLVEYVDAGYNVYQVRYDPSGLESSPFGSLLPIGGGGGATRSTASSDKSMGEERGIIRGAVRWLVRNILPVIKDEVTKELNIETSSTSKVQERYMIKDPGNTSNNIKVQG